MRLGIMCFVVVPHRVAFQTPSGEIQKSDIFEQHFPASPNFFCHFFLRKCVTNIVLSICYENVSENNHKIKTV